MTPVYRYLCSNCGEDQDRYFAYRDAAKKRTKCPACRRMTYRRQFSLIAALKIVEKGGANYRFVTPGESSLGRFYDEGDDKSGRPAKRSGKRTSK